MAREPARHARTRFARAHEEHGSALLLVLGALIAVLLGALVLGGVARGLGVVGERQRAADLAALAGARAMREVYPRVPGSSAAASLI